MMNRKQNEDQEMFRSVMSEVGAITKKSPGSSQGSPAGGTPTDPMGMVQMPYNIPGQQMPPSNMLCAGPPHPMTSSGMGWNRPGGSLPNVHQMAQNPVDAYNNWGGYWSAAPQMQQPHPQQNHSYAQTHRSRSPGHYHPYRKSNERIPQLDSSSPTSVHLQPPDNSWSKYSNFAKSL